MYLPNVIICGAAKCGTTTLFDVLSQHDQVSTSIEKEVEFFSVDKNFSKGVDYYRSFFREDNRVILEASPNYFLDDSTPGRIFDLLGDRVKLIFVLRNPYERAFSLYNYRVKEGFEDKSFDDAIKLEGSRISSTKEELHLFPYKHGGRYYTLLSSYLSWFGMDKVHIIDFDELVANPRLVYKRLFDFLGLEFLDSIDLNTKSNEAATYRFKTLLYFRRQSKLKAMLRGLFPSSCYDFLAKSYGQFLNRFNTKELEEVANPPVEVYDTMAQELDPELVQLKSLIGVDFSKWCRAV